MKNKGQMLIEVIVAVGILTLVLIGVSDLMTRSSHLLSYQKDRDEANTIGRELLNKYRQERNVSGTVTSGNSEGECVAGKKFQCEVEILEVTEGVLTKVTVSWVDGPNTHQIVVDQLLTNL